MKRLLFLLMSAGSVMSASAQDAAQPAPKMKDKSFTADSSLPRWVVDVNLLGGVLTQNMTSAASGGNYLNGVNMNTGDLKFKQGSSFGFDAQLGYFFGKSCHWGIGTGFMYLSQHGNVNLNNYHVEYQATDANGDVFRQVVSSNNAKEALNITNINIPLVLKYKARFSKRLGFTADAGVLFNMQMSNSYKTSGTFDYEGIYDATGGSGTDGRPYVYDNAPTPAATDYLITRNAYFATHPGGDVQAFFQQQRAAGRGVALDVNAAKSTGSVKYPTGSVGLFLQPSLAYYVSDNVALSFGVYYMYQSFKHNADNGYRTTTGNPGEYSSVLNNVTQSDNQSMGLNVGMRFLFGKMKDTDGDGIPDKRDNCPTVWGLEQFHGCPDTDGDGIQDSEDSCPTVKGLLKFHGCPDTDGDGIADRDDACPYQAGPASLHGCPDADGDGIADKDDACPVKAGLAQFHGCPDTDGDGIPDNEDQCPTVAGTAEFHGCPPPPPPPPVQVQDITSTPIHFEVNKVVIHHDSYPILEAAAAKLKADPKGIVEVDGYTDITGKRAYNKALSLKRANSVKKHLMKLGVKAKQIKVVGHGENSPVASNDTPEGRLENRRAVMKLNVAE